MEGVVVKDATVSDTSPTASGTLRDRNLIETDIDLAKVMKAWPDLSDPIRAAILAMIRVAKFKK